MTPAYAHALALELMPQGPVGVIDGKDFVIRWQWIDDRTATFHLVEIRKRRPETAWREFTRLVQRELRLRIRRYSRKLAAAAGKRGGAMR